MAATLHWIALAQNVGVERIIIAGYNRDILKRNFLFLLSERMARETFVLFCLAVN